ncbi:MAG: PspC domain-containing protein [Clostridiales bacterium]|nr:PspC domain-containing protein [Clostridiales bacterium]
MQPKRLFRSRTDRTIAGICGGIAQYANIDPTVVRVLAVIFASMGGFGLIAYIVLIFVIPENPEF